MKLSLKPLGAAQRSNIDVCQFAWFNLRTYSRALKHAITNARPRRKNVCVRVANITIWTTLVYGTPPYIFRNAGNFSFGDYFKFEAIPFAWELVTKELDIPKDKLLVTVYHTDDEAADMWKKVAGLSDDRIIRIATNDNFWMMGPTGPCGPCTEIFYDHGESFWGGPPGSPDEDGDRFIEIWNLVFMQYEQFEDGSKTDLPNQSIDTGMGIERVAALLQGTNDNYSTDLIRSLIEASAHATSSDPDGPGKTHHRVIADHLRSTSFLIADGVMPSNDGRGYVLRRIMRRAMRHAHLLGSQDPVMHRLVPALVQQMGAAYPELSQAQALIEETLLQEETRLNKRWIVV